MQVNKQESEDLGGLIGAEQTAIYNHLDVALTHIGHGDFTNIKRNLEMVNHLCFALNGYADLLAHAAWQGIVDTLIEKTGTAEHSDVVKQLQYITNGIASMQQRTTPNGRHADAFSVHYAAAFAQATLMARAIGAASDATERMCVDQPAGTFQKFLGGDIEAGRGLLEGALKALDKQGIKLAPTDSAALDRLFGAPSPTTDEAGRIAAAFASRLGLDPSQIDVQFIDLHTADTDLANGTDSIGRLVPRYAGQGNAAPAAA